MRLDMGFDKEKILFSIQILGDDNAPKLRSLESLVKVNISQKKQLDQETFRKIMKALGDQLVYESNNPKFFGASPDTPTQATPKVKNAKK